MTLNLRDGDTVLVRATVKTVRGKPRLQFKNGEARLETTEADIASIEKAIFQGGDKVEVHQPGEQPAKGIVTKVGDTITVTRVDGGGDVEVKPELVRRV